MPRRSAAGKLSTVSSSLRRAVVEHDFQLQKKRTPLLSSGRAPSHQVQQDQVEVQSDGQICTSRNQILLKIHPNKELELS